jgi:hypothetical protein
MKLKAKRVSNRNVMYGSMWFMHRTSFAPEYVRTSFTVYMVTPAELRGLRLYGGTEKK